DVVDETSINSGIALADWFGNEAKRVYGVLAETDQDREHRELAELVRRKGGSIGARELMRSSRRYRASDDAEAALDHLVKVGTGRWEHVPAGPTGGKPTRRFILVDAADVDDTSATAEENEGYVNVNTVSSGNGHADPDDINRLFDQA